MATELRSVVAVKEASGSINQMAAVIQEMPKGFTVLSGDDSMTLPLMILGGAGVISVVSNIIPGKVVEMTHAAHKGDFGKARKLHFDMLELFNTAFIETNPIPIKAAASMMAMCEEEYRLPMCRMSDANREKLKQCLKKYALIS